MSPDSRPTCWLLLALISLPWTTAASAVLRVQLQGDGVEGAVVSLHSPEAAARTVPMRAVMDQRGRQFEPRVLWVTVDSEVTFPNNDDIRHHVYSFSPTQRFELPLYSGTPSAPVRFPVAGVVTLGCNIHDWMLGHIVVLDTPYAAIADAEGWVEIDAPAGAYGLRIWHSRLQAAEGWMETPFELPAEGAELAQALNLRPAEPPKLSDDEHLRALQERFRALRKDR
jgi:plastocyanin